jgi:UDP-glucose 4-epimerase
MAAAPPTKDASMSLKVLLTGGTGYIGTHTCVQLQEQGHEVTLLDNLANSSSLVTERISAITGTRPVFIEADLCDEAALKSVFSRNSFDAVIHFAGLKAVAESVAQPLRYYRNNVGGTFNLLAAMQQAGVKKLVFSSSATVYGVPQTLPIPETAPLSATNPYGQSKLWIEQLLQDTFQADNSWRIASLRYFNPVGAHESGLIGENPRGIPNNLMPYLGQVALGKLPRLAVFGSDYPTVDGTGVRDYIHVVDLALGHAAALDALSSSQPFLTVNLGCGRGYSVLEMVRAFEKAAGRTIPYSIEPRRPGDVAACFADTRQAEAVLKWRARFGLDRMCTDVWRFLQKNPDGYR